MKKRAISLLLFIMMIVALIPSAAFAADEEAATPIKIIVNNMDDDTTVEDSKYDDLYDADSAEEGVKAIIASGNYIINEFAVPATEEELESDYPDGYTVNGVKWLYQSEEGWMGGNGGQDKFDTYEEAAFATATGLPAGLETELYDTDGDGKVDRIETKYLEALIVDEITENDDGTYSVNRGAPDASIEFSENDGKLFDGDKFAVGNTEVIKAENFDTEIKEGDVALFWLGSDGWVMFRALEVSGIFVEGVDHEYYNIDGTEYQDAMRFSRDNIIISNRNGEFANAHNYFGLTNNEAGLEVSLWLVPTTNYPDAIGAPIGITGGENSKTFLETAIAAAKAKLEGVAASADGTDLDLDAQWTTQEVYDELADAIERAEAAIEVEESSAYLDYQVYLLYLTLNGSAQDIGAKYAGYEYVGFDNQIKTGVFTDVDSEAYYADAVLWAVKEKITTGTTSTTFGPDDSCTRAQAVTFLWRASGSPEPTVTENPFTDVEESDYFYKAVLWAVEEGITTGVTETTFDPNGVCTRGQIVTFQYRAAGSPDVEGDNAFTDVADDDYYAAAVLWAAKEGVTTGATETTFEPDGNCTRAQIVTFLYRQMGSTTQTETETDADTEAEAETEAEVDTEAEAAAE